MIVTVTIRSDADPALLRGNGSFERRYWVKVTNAPARYDSGNTIRGPEMYGANGHTGQLVLIPDFDLEWHRGRYGSGLYWLDEPDELLNGKAVVDELVERLLMPRQEV